MEELFLQACSDGQMDVIDDLIGKVNINCVDEDNNTGLMLACNCKEPWVFYTLDVVNKLLHHGADVNIENSSDYDALEIILKQSNFHPQLASLLLLCGKNGIERLDSYGYGRIWACNTIDSYRFVVENGGDVNQTPDGNTVYHYATYNVRITEEENLEENTQEKELVQYLKSVGATKNFY